MNTLRKSLAIGLAVALHAVFLTWATRYTFTPADRPETPPATESIVLLDLPPPPTAEPPPASMPAEPQVTPPAPDAPLPAPASMDAPPAPTAEEWAFAAAYPLKNSKGYRYSWGQQVRSMMGTAVEGADQGAVRFRVEIAPDGTLSALDTLWSTSAFVEALARKAVLAMPPLPPTPTGQPLIFEKTIAFSAYLPEIPPIYRDDCLPDPPTFRNPFAWNGQGHPGAVATAAHAQGTAATPAMSLEDCLKLLPRDSIEAEAAHDQLQLDRWASGRLGR
ncbi:MAG: energy transducer TonB [Burkholderiaceae bacterium]